MSDNYRFYKAKIVERRARMGLSALTLQLHEILKTVTRCEAMWSLEDRVERSR